MDRRPDDTAQPTGLVRYLPVAGWLPRYESSWLSLDLQAGLITAAVVIPQAMAYASIAGLPVEVGLYTALAPMVVYALFGTSRPLSVSTTSTIALLTGSALAALGLGSNPVDYIIPAASLAVLVGVFLLVAGLLQLGFIANLISDPVLAGFKAGIGVVIFVSQLGKVLGLPLESGPILRTMVTVLQSLDAINWPTLVISVITLAILWGLPRIAKRIPAPLVAVAFGIVLSAVADLEALGVNLVGPIQGGLPSLTLPDLSLWQSLWPAALGIALMSFVESVAAGRSFARHGDGAPDSSQELIALGLANVGGGLTQAMPAGGGTSQTAVNSQSGAQSQIAGLVTAGVVLLTLLFLAPLIGLMPEATLGAMVLVAAAGLIKLDEFRDIHRIRDVELAWAIVAFLGVLFLGTLQGIVLAVIVSIMALLYYAEHPPVYVVGRKGGTAVFRPLEDHSHDKTYPGLLMLRSEGLLFFGSASGVIDRMTEFIREDAPDVVALDCSAITNIEYTALKQLAEFNQTLEEGGIDLWLCALNPGALTTVRRSPLSQDLGEEALFINLVQVVETYQDQFLTGSID